MNIRHALIALATFASFQCEAATAFFTGRQEYVTTVTYQVAVRCQYQYSGQCFWAIFTGFCPSSIEVH